MATAKQIIQEANKYLGAVQGGMLHRSIVDIYNSHKPLARGYALKYNDDWCDGFVSAIAIKCGCVDLIGTEVGVQRHVDIFKKKGIWIGKVKPQQGDIFVMDYERDGWGDHIGFVQYVEGNTVHTTEGNYVENGVSKVKSRSFQWNDSRIQGYARPKYSQEQPTPTPNPPAPTPVSNKQRLYLAKTAERWRVYPLDKQPVVGNECGFIYPKRFDGLDYEILYWTIKDTVCVIQTRDYGKVQIYVADPEAKIVNENTQKPITVDSKVILNNNATYYATGELIPTNVKGKTYTVMEINPAKTKALLKEIYSWVKISDIQLK